MAVESTDLEAFDAFAEQIAHPVGVITIGGFLPGRQIMAKGYAITFLFGDNGEFFNISIMRAT